MSAAEERPALLIVEDDAATLRQLRWTFEDYEVATARDRAEALEQLRVTRPPVVLLDLGLPPDASGASEGFAILSGILGQLPETKVIVVTGREEHEHALQAVAQGAFDFFRKPLEAHEIRLLVHRALQLHRLEQENRQLARQATSGPLPEVVAVGEPMLRVTRLVERAAGSDISVVLVGESGSGRETLARALHARSQRAGAPWIAVHCTAIPEQLLESELFGHERGAFTGAIRRSQGMLELAEGGTLFLDEIGDMPLAVQPRLLRFLQEGVIQRVGGRTAIPIDARIVCATSKDLQSCVDAGELREDLYYRLCGLVIEIPPLRDRPDDAVALARHFFERFRKETERPLRGLAPDAVAAVVSHAWPGNVQELENRMKRAVLFAERSRVTARDLDLAASQSDRPPQTLHDAVGETEGQEVRRAWAEAAGNVTRASKLLGVSRPTLYKLLREHGLRD